MKEKNVAFDLAAEELVPKPVLSPTEGRRHSDAGVSPSTGAAP